MNQDTVTIKNQNNGRIIQRAPRLEPNYFMVVLDAETNEVIGKVVNFNESGMQLMMQNEINLNQIQELILVNKNNKEKQYIKVFAELLWTKPCGEQNMVRGGFYLCSKNFKSKFRMNKLISSFSQND